MSKFIRHFKTGALSLACVMGLTGPVLAEDVIRAVTAFPKQLAFSQSFLGFVDLVNERGEGVVRIDYIGGPEAVPLELRVRLREHLVLRIAAGGNRSQTKLPP